jgi:DNA gyrase subunit A
MDVGKSGKVIAMDVARDDMDLLVVTENGYGKRTQISQYRKTHRGAKGVKTIGLTEKKGGLAGALVVREHHELVFISVGGMVQRTSAGGISQQGRSATGVRVMNLKEDDLVSAIAVVVDAVESSDGPTDDTVDGPTAGSSMDLTAAEAPGEQPTDDTEADDNDDTATEATEATEADGSEAAEDR